MASISLFSPAESLQVACVESQPFGENTYVVSRAGDRRCVVIDPGFEPQAIIDWLDSHGLEPEAILLTHGHSDHIAGNAALRERWPSLPIVIGRHDAAKLTNPAGNLSAAFGMNLVSPPADRLLDHGEIVSLAGLDLAVREIPGHSRGHVVFVAEALSPVFDREPRKRQVDASGKGDVGVDHQNLAVVPPLDSPRLKGRGERG
jgi:glyoxylase-like metal-dependent hydrolase (beta-lactamase superfamily II)